MRWSTPASTNFFDDVVRRRDRHDRALDRLRVAADLGAPLVEHGVLVREVLGLPPVFHMSAYSATSRSVTFSPPPPIMIGSSPTGAGVSLPRRDLMRGSAASSACSRPMAVPNS